MPSLLPGLPYDEFGLDLNTPHVLHVGATPPPPAAPTTNNNPNNNNGSNSSSGGIDYKALLGGDPIYQQLLAALQAQGTSAGLNRRDALRRLLVSYGQIAPGWSDQYGDIDQATRDQAQQATDMGVSSSAQLAHQHARAIQDLRGNFASRGILSSGDAGAGENEENLGDTIRKYDTAQKLLASINDVYQGYTTNLQQIEQQRVGGLGDSFGRQLSLAQALGGLGGGSGTSGGGGGSGGVDLNDFQRNAALPAGMSAQDVYNTAATHAPTYNGQQFVANNIAQEGVAPPGYMWIKYSDPTHRQGSDTVLVPVGNH